MNKQHWRGSLQVICSVCVVGMLSLVGLPQASAKAGRLDPSFGTGGRAVAALDFGDPRFWYGVNVHAALAPDNRILVSGDGLVLRYLPNGRLDRSFARGGLLRVDSAENHPFGLSGLEVDTQGRIVAAGTVNVNSTPSPPFAVPQAAVLRFKPNGSPDPTFGDGDGAVVTDLGLPPPATSSYPSTQEVTGAAIDAAGRIVISGSTIRGDSGYCGAIARGYVGRLTPQGDADPTFGDSGVVVYDPLLLASAHGVVLDDIGAPLFFGRAYECRGSGGVGSVIEGLRVDGSPNSSFGGDGQVAVDEYIRAIGVDHAGRIIVLQDGQVIRLLSSGVRDHSFGHGGKASIPVRGAWSNLTGLAVSRGGGVVATGTRVHHTPLKGTRGHKPEPRRRLVLARLGPRGVLDRHFGDAGTVTTRFGRPSNTVGRQVLLDGKDHVIVAGMVRNRRLSTGEGLALFRYDLTR